MTNSNLVTRFLAGGSAKNLSMKSERGVLFSYNTAIAQIWHTAEKKYLIVNRTKYSSTTSGKHQNPLFSQMGNFDYKIIVVSGVPFNTQDLETFAEREIKEIESE